MRLCEHCRVEIPATTRVDARYCSATCRKAAHRDRHDSTLLSLLRRGVPESVEWQLPTRKCEHCETPLPHEMRRHARYCSARCRKGGAAARVRAERERQEQIEIGVPIGVAGFVRPSCAGCGVVMPEGRRVDAKYCSAGCRRERHSRQARHSNDKSRSPVWVA